MVLPFVLFVPFVANLLPSPFWAQPFSPPLAVTEHVQSKHQQIEFAVQVTARFRIDCGIDQLAKVVDFLAQFHFDRQTIGILQDLERQPKIFRNAAIVIQIQGFTFSREVVEQSLPLSLFNPVLCQFVQEFHEHIIPLGARNFLSAAIVSVLGGQ